MGAVAALFLHCGHGSSRPADPTRSADLTADPTADLAKPPGPVHPLIGYEAHFLITWQGARIGDAAEALRARGADDVRFERRERITVRRGDALAHSETLLIIDTDAALRARHVAMRQISNGAVQRWEARRNRDGDWLITTAEEPARLVPGDAVPADLVPLLLATARRAPASAASSDAAFDGPVVLAGYGFATAHLRMRAANQRTLTATLSAPGGVLRGRFFLGQGGTVMRVRSDDGSGAIRVDAATAAAPFVPPEIVDAASLPLASPAGPVQALRIEPVSAARALPPDLPGQRIDARAGGWHVRLTPGDADAPPASPAPSPVTVPDAALARLAARIIAESSPATAREEAFALARATAALLEDDLGAPTGGARTALAQGRGDCTAHSLLFAALAQARGISSRLVTGYRLDRDRLVRHRWALVAVDGVWIAVDPTHGEAPAAPRLVGLAIHGPRAAELALADDLAFAGLAGARARACAPALSGRPCARSTPRTR